MTTYNFAMFLLWILGMTLFKNIGINGDWIQIPQKTFGPIKNTGFTIFTETKTPVNVIFVPEQIEHLESINGTTNLGDKLLDRQDFNTMRTNPIKSSILDIFTSSTTGFTPLMSSVSVTMSPVPTSLPTRRSEDSRNLRRNKKEKRNNINNHSNVENITSKSESRHMPGDSTFNSYTSFMPFIKSIQSILLQKAHKTIKNKIQILKNLRDNLLYDIDQRIHKLWSPEESSARDYKEESHIEFPSNEGALMTIGFLTLAVFLVKLVLQVIAAIKAKKAYYNTTTTTTASTGRKKRYLSDNNSFDDEITYRILNLIDTYKVQKPDNY